MRAIFGTNVVPGIDSARQKKAQGCQIFFLATTYQNGGKLAKYPQSKHKKYVLKIYT
jgi:hypothetical protein